MRFFILFLCITKLLFGFDGWIHLELGAGNYGEYSGKKNKEHSDPEVQYGVLFWTLDELVTRHGQTGIMCINDIKPEYAEYTADKLREYALRKGYSYISVISIPGDYRQTNFSSLLAEYEREYYDSIHLKNPEGNFYGRRRKKDPMGASRLETRNMLQRLANLCHHGLYLFILDTPHFLPIEEKTEFINRAIFYRTTEEWDAIDYYHPNGKTIEGGRVLFIPRDAP
ncbi:MAG: hypothetical protein KR126chlam3_00434 [Chlamydiae bacterium]|nr:hypothetical protein [Chlamydiota bacterium]